MKQGIADLNAEMKQDIADLKAEIKQDIARLEARMAKQDSRLSRLEWGAFAAIALLVKIAFFN